MELTKTMFVDFLKRVVIFDKDVSSAMAATSNMIKEHEEREQNEQNKMRLYVGEKIKSYSGKIDITIHDFQSQIKDIMYKDISNKMGIFVRLQKCKEFLSLLTCAEESIINKTVYLSGNKDISQQTVITVDEILQGKIDFASLAYKVNEVLKKPKKKEDFMISESFYGTCRMAEKALSQEIALLQNMITQNRDSLYDNYRNTENSTDNIFISNWTLAKEVLRVISHSYAQQRDAGRLEMGKVYESNFESLRHRINNLANTFCRKFPSQELADEYLRLCTLEPSYGNYECYNEMPRNVLIGTLEYNTTNLGLSESTKSFLNKYYYFMYQGNKIKIPYCVSFGMEFNYLFKFSGEGRPTVVKNACDLGMRLFMMLPPGKVKFTFIDPVTLGESFAMFTRLVDIDDRTSEIINGKIWFSPADIENKLKIMTDHISNVTQRCLQGKFSNIFEYNHIAEQNAEAYQILMLMDFPAGFTDQSLKLLEQIVTSGPRCGVFTIIYRNESQYQKISERSYPLIANIETNFQVFNYLNNCKEVVCSEDTFKDKSIFWKEIELPGQDKLDGIIATLKKGIKNADKVVIDIEKVSKAETTYTTKDGIRIPIGIRGANEVQYLTLGVGGSHHALIAGVAGSGKSSLLHTIILRTLTQYSPDELIIYLVDFKRGVEFKIYADFILPSFKVVAIESEREFGYNILVALEREQKIRADLFKKGHVDKIEEYRNDLGKKMPRILLIMDEFHELFSNANDEFSKKSAIIMERIVRQGRAFGVHLILASQSYSNITGVDRAVFDQMAVRIVLKSSKTDANLLLDNGSSEIDQISIDDPGRAVYNSEAGNKEYNSHFRVAYIEPSKHRGMLKEISKSTRKFVDPKYPTRILLSNIEDNNYSIFNQFSSYNAMDYKTPGRLYIGEPLSVTNNMNINFTRAEYANLLMVGEDTDKARSMFTFAILSLCINYWVIKREIPRTPFITLFNCKPLDDSYFKDTPKLVSEMLPEYINYITCGDVTAIQKFISDLHDNTTVGKEQEVTDKYFFVFGYQRAEELKSEKKVSQSEDIDNIFNIMPGSVHYQDLSTKDLFRNIVKEGSLNGIHTILWQDSFNALYQDDKDMVSYFSMRIAFDMSPEEYSRFVSANDVGLISENNAIYYNKAADNQKFRPYQAPDEEWLNEICDKLH